MHIALVVIAWLLIVLVVWRIWSIMGIVQQISNRDACLQLVGENLTTLNILLLAFLIRSLAGQ